MVAGQFMAWKGERERQRAIALTLHGDGVKKVFSVHSHLASTKDGPVAFPGPGSQAIRRRPGVGHPNMGANGGAKRPSLTTDTRHHLTIVQVRSTAKGGLQGGDPSHPSDWRHLPRQTPFQIVTRLGRLAFDDNRQNGHHDARLWHGNRPPQLPVTCFKLHERPFDQAEQMDQAHTHHHDGSKMLQARFLLFFWTKYEQCHACPELYHRGPQVNLPDRCSKSFSEDTTTLTCRCGIRLSFT